MTAITVAFPPHSNYADVTPDVTQTLQSATHSTQYACAVHGGDISYIIEQLHSSTAVLRGVQFVDKQSRQAQSYMTQTFKC